MTVSPNLSLFLEKVRGEGAALHEARADAYIHKGAHTHTHMRTDLVALNAPRINAVSVCACGCVSER